jgi:hypothetical protein
MRKCGVCGYLLFGDGEACNHCGTTLSVTAPVGAGRAASDNGTAPELPPRASWPPAPLAPTPGARAPQDPSMLPPVPMPPGPNAQPVPEVWRPVTFTPAPSATRKFPAGLVLAIVAFVIIGGLGFSYVRGRNALPGGTSDFVAGNGVSFTAPDRSYTAQFPEEPTVTHSEVPIGNSQAQLSLASVETKSYEMGSTSFDFGLAVPKSRVQRVLEQAIGSGITHVNGDAVSMEKIQRGGLSALDATFKAPDGYSARVLVMLKGSRIYLLYVHAKSGTDKLFEAFDKSFVPTGL